MRIPKAFSIRGKPWRVVYRRALKDEDDSPCNGLCEPSTRTVYLATGLGKVRTQVFLHELMHAVFFEYGFFVSSLTPDVEEMICQIFAQEFEERFRFKWKKCL